MRILYYRFSPQKRSDRDFFALFCVFCAETGFPPDFYDFYARVRVRAMIMICSVICAALTVFRVRAQRLI